MKFLFDSSTNSRSVYWRFVSEDKRDKRSRLLLSFLLKDVLNRSSWGFVCLTVSGSFIDHDVQYLNTWTLRWRWNRFVYCLALTFWVARTGEFQVSWRWKKQTSFFWQIRQNCTKRVTCASNKLEIFFSPERPTTEGPKSNQNAPWRGSKTIRCLFFLKYHMVKVHGTGPQR